MVEQSPKSPSSNRQRRLGLSLLETVISGFVLTLVIIFVASLFPGSLLAIQTSESLIQADYLASSLVEEIRHQSFDDMVALPPATVTRGRSELSYTTEVGPVPNSDPRFLKKVRVVVTWTERSKSREVVRETWVHALRR